MLNVVTLSIVMVECHFAQCSYVECCYTVKRFLKKNRSAGATTIDKKTLGLKAKLLLSALFMFYRLSFLYSYCCNVECRYAQYRNTEYAQYRNTEYH